ncbi:lipopolysaccharide kinase InaA family protein [Akkermansiaceae bacterium]|nr:lipopolysaccharide kinase InaA family protein [bacterium]MDB4282473.1 lipopolysaccharide kinase InaA family protein [Akkermansiaceae bacterium]MDB4310018.1 lipopolysaccharide kinase InaA family protein [Akkermansiaceae bacterium]MDB4313039.1 lipopolysaccharide kinase InaA family protein [Akkermansiaceae bacterium]MDB4328184.1 lipopolysaccharide kinase InaA family protein [Akkermansiaceae bacterium]
MGEKKFEELSLAGFSGKVRSDLAKVFSSSKLAGFAKELRNSDLRVLAAGRHRIIVLPLEVDGKADFVVVKQFGKQAGWKDRYDQERGSKAARSFEAAEFLMRHGVGTPEPLAYFERWEGKQLVESYYLSRYLDSLTSFKDELIRLYEEQPECDRIVSLLDHVARSMRKMHDAGFYHRDLGNQNMELLPAKNGEWGEVQFIDLNRGRIKETLTLKERAVDFSRITLPGVLLAILMTIYWDGDPPRKFRKKVKKLRQIFYLRQQSHRWRHPFRTPKVGNGPAYPEVQNIWIWDKQSAQATITMDRKERKKHYPKGRHSSVFREVLRSGGRIWNEYQSLLPQAFANAVKMEGCFGMALESTDLDFKKQQGFLTGLGKIPVLLRFCHHEGASQWRVGIEQVKALHAAGHEVMIAMVQDRNAVLEPESWAAFLNEVLIEVGELVRTVELCHAVNRIKWGVHSPAEQRILLEPVTALQKKFPAICFTGPACIDFEYHYVLSALGETPDGLHYGALSHHLYVDRRGAPENRQGGFSTLEKCALLRAICRSVPQCADRLIVSEVNWPLKGTGVWSPVAAGYIHPGDPEHRLNVSELEYGHFMLRYLVLSVCSGFVDQVFWWRLVAHGFGLIDERSDNGWRERPGYRMLVQFFKLLGSATFVEKFDIEDDVYALRFETNQESVVMAWCNGGTYRGDLPFSHSKILDVYGSEISDSTLGEAPIYLSCPIRSAIS